MANTTLAIVEDEKVVRESLHTFLTNDPNLEVLWVEASVEAMLDSLQAKKPSLPDIILLDINLPGMTGIEGISWLKAKAPLADIVMLTTFEDEDSIFSALREGACSYLSKRTSLAGIRDALLVVKNGGSYMSPSIARKVIGHFNPAKNKKERLTPRQKQIVQGIVEGLSYQEIGEKLFISIDTVRSHIKKIYQQLNLNSKTELIKKSLKGEI